MPNYTLKEMTNTREFSIDVATAAHTAIAMNRIATALEHLNKRLSYTILNDHGYDPDTEILEGEFTEVTQT